MNVKKWVVTLSAVLFSVATFAQTAPQDQNQAQQLQAIQQMEQLLQQYQVEQDKLNKQFDEKLLPNVQLLVREILTIQQSGQEDLTPVQEAKFQQYGNQIDKFLTELAAPAVKELDLVQVNAQYQEMMRQMGVTDAPQLTKESVTEMMKGVYMINALVHFEQARKLTPEELEVAIALFIPHPEEEEDAQ